MYIGHGLSEYYDTERPSGGGSSTVASYHPISGCACAFGADAAPVPAGLDWKKIAVGVAIGGFAWWALSPFVQWMWWLHKHPKRSLRENQAT